MASILQDGVIWTEDCERQYYRMTRDATANALANLATDGDDGALLALADLCEERGWLALRGMLAIPCR